MVLLRYELDTVLADRARNRLEAFGGDMSPAMDEIGAMLVAHTVERFERGVGPDGTPWRPSIRAREQGGQTMRDSGRLATSFTHEFGPEFVEAGTNVIYAAIHQTGGTISAKGDGYLTFRIGNRWARKKSVTIPARPMVGLADDDREDIVEILERHLTGEAR